MFCIRTDRHGQRKLAKRSYVWELQECLRLNVDPRCIVYTVYDNRGRPYVVIDAPCPSAPGRPFSRHVYHKGANHEQIARTVYDTISKYPESFLPTVYGDNFMEKWVRW